jgi:hypothetical protein
VKVVSLLTSANSLKLLHRFLHKDLPVLTRGPLPDRSNLRDNYVNPSDMDVLKHEWQFYRTWIRLLHFPNMVPRKDQYHIPRALNPGREIFIPLYRIGKLLLVPNKFHLRTANPACIDFGCSWQVLKIRCKTLGYGKVLWK